MNYSETTVTETNVTEEFYKTTEKAHIVTCWFGIVLNLIWFVSDYLTIPEYWTSFLYFRIIISLIILIALVLKKVIKLNIYWCLLILVVGISIQNAYMWSVMNISQFQNHSLAYSVLFIGVGMLVLWEFKLSIILLVITLISNILFYLLNSNLKPNEVLSNGGLFVLTVLVFCVFLIRNRYQLKYKETKSRLELEASKSLIELQKQIVEDKNSEIFSSLRYAKRLQKALLPQKNTLDSLFKNGYFVLYNPRDIVCGDFYWAKKINTTPLVGSPKEYILLAVADCTGHGVPGAFMSLLGSSFLDQSSVAKEINTPADALDFLNRKIISTLNNGNEEGEIRDGMDISLIAIDEQSKTLTFSGANNPIYIVRKKELHVLKPTKQAIGNMNNEIKPFLNDSFQLMKEDCIYLFTDGYADQFGGPKEKKLMKKVFEKTLIENSDTEMENQKKCLELTFNNWKGNLEQVDDVCVIGIKI